MGSNAGNTPAASWIAASPTVGGIISTPEILEAWVMANMEPLVLGGQDYHHDVLIEVFKALLRR